jgi:hypothetical protein
MTPGPFGLCLCRVELEVRMTPNDFYDHWRIGIDIDRPVVVIAIPWLV